MGPLDYPPGLPPFVCALCHRDLSWQEYELRQTICVFCQDSDDDDDDDPPPPPLPPLETVVDHNDPEYTALITEAHAEALRTGRDEDIRYVHWTHNVHSMRQEVQIKEALIAAQAAHENADNDNDQDMDLNRNGTPAPTE